MHYDDQGDVLVHRKGRQIHLLPCHGQWWSPDFEQTPSALCLGLGRSGEGATFPALLTNLRFRPAWEWFRPAFRPMATA